jgi:signal transduction histidine kinase
MIKVEYHQFFSLFGEDKRRLLLEATEHRLYESGSRIFDEGDVPDALYLVLDGEVELRKRTESGTVEVLARVCGDECFGEMGVLDGGGRSAAAFTVTDARLARISSDALLEALRDEPSSTIIHMFRSISDRLRRTDSDYVAETFRRDRFQQVGEVAGSLLRYFENPLTTLRENAVSSGGPAGEQAERMQRMVETIANYSSLGDGEIELSRQACTLERVLESFVAQNRIFLSVRQIALDAKGGSETIHVDGPKIIDVLQLLLNNAIEAGAKSISIATYWQPSTVELSFRDDGSGVPERIRDTLFSPFVTEGKAPAIGLGLAMAESIVVAHGGHIRYQPGESNGSLFIVSIPIGS